MENEKGIESVWDSVINRKANTYEGLARRKKNEEYGFMINHSKRMVGIMVKGFN